MDGDGRETRTDINHCIRTAQTRLQRTQNGALPEQSARLFGSQLANLIASLLAAHRIVRPVLFASITLCATGEVQIFASAIGIDRWNGWGGAEKGGNWGEKERFVSFARID